MNNILLNMVSLLRFLFLVFFFKDSHLIGDILFTPPINDTNAPPLSWCYHSESCNESKWEGDCHSRASHQSPVALPRDTNSFHGSHDFVVFPRDNLIFPGFTVAYKAHTVTVYPQGKKFAFQRPLHGNHTQEMTLWALDFHWGYVYNRGSEHALDNQSYPMEVHLGFYDATKFDPEKGEPLPKYKGDKDLLAVGVFLDIAGEAEFLEQEETGKSKDSQVLAPLVDKLQNLERNKVRYYKEELNLTDLFTGKVAYKYGGSFTTPSCRQVEWWVLRHALIVPLEHIQAFRDATVGGAKIGGNNKRKKKPIRVSDISLLKFKYDE